MDGEQYSGMGVWMRRTAGALVTAGVAAATLAGCLPGVPPVAETPERQFAARQLAAVALTVEDFGPGWEQLPGEEGEGGGPGSEEPDVGDPCTWVSEWIPDVTAFSTQSWRMYTAGDDATFASDWIAAAAPGADLLDELDVYRETLSACTTHTYDDGSTLDITPGEHPDLGDDSFSYLATFTGPDGSSWGHGEVHTVVCGPLWLHLSYVGYDPFIERDSLLETFVGRASELGGC